MVLLLYLLLLLVHQLEYQEQALSLVFSTSYEIAKKTFKNKERKEKKTTKIVLAAKCKLNSIENIISTALKENEISHEDFTTIINEERNYCKSKGSSRMMKSQRSNIDRDKLIKDGIRMEIDEIIKQNKRINNNL